MKVLLSNESIKVGTSRKLTSPWIGPFEIVKVNKNGTLTLHNLGKRGKQNQTVHANRVKPYFSKLQDVN